MRCDDACFSVYRVNDKSYLPPGLPGWMVCRVSADECFSLDQDEASCGLDQTPERMEQAVAVRRRGSSSRRDRRHPS